jgi:SAM-dependent methyltransferase
MSDLYKHPEQYDREHLADEEDIGFYVSLGRKLRPRKVLELGCGTGRITLPLAQIGFDVVGLDNEPQMLHKAEERRLQSASEIRQRLVFIEGDMRTWAASSDFDLILIPCSSISHVLSLEDQLAVWTTCHGNLRPGGRFLVEINMPNMASFADSFSVPSRTPVEIDIDSSSESDGTRLIRRKTTRYLSHEQLAQIRFMYDKYQHGRGVETYIDDFVSHVFFPRELRLLFLHTGYEIEDTIGDYSGRTLKPDSPLILMIGRRKE